MTPRSNLETKTPRFVRANRGARFSRLHGCARSPAIARFGRFWRSRSSWRSTAFISPGFFTIRIVEGRLFGNLIDILYRAMPTAVVALGMAVVIGTKGIDLSVGSVIAIVGAVITWRIHAGDPHFVVLLFALGVGVLCGLWNGFLVAVLDIQPIIATLILMVSGRGIGLMINLLYGGTNPSFTSPLLQGLSVGHVGLVPTRLILGAAIFGALWLLMRRTALGLFLESVGGNSAAADLAGINARLIKYAAYLICGLCAAWAGVVLAADTHTSDPVSVGLYIELDAILAVVIGGGSLSGGRIYLGMTRSGRAGHSDADHVDSHQRPAAGVQSGGQGVRGHRRPAAAIGQSARGFVERPRLGAKR